MTLLNDYRLTDRDVDGIACLRSGLLIVIAAGCTFSTYVAHSFGTRDGSGGAGLRYDARGNRRRCCATIVVAAARRRRR